MAHPGSDAMSELSPKCAGGLKGSTQWRALPQHLERWLLSVESKLCICRETARTSHRTDAEQSLHVVSCVLAPIPGCAFEPNRFENVEPDRFRTLYQIAHSERRWMLDKVDNTARPGPADSKQFRAAHLPVPLGGRISGHLREAHQGGAAGSA